jgi:cytochrome P450
MCVVDNAEAGPPILARPTPLDGKTSLRQFLRTLRDNSIATWRAETYASDVEVRRLLWRRTVVVNEPSGIKHVLLDNAANYRKSELMRRLLGPGLGRGLLTSDGEPWRRHRRIMAPSFDHRSIVGYAPLMVEVAADLLAKWDALPDRAETDVATDMMHLTLQIISRAMFSSDSDEIVHIVAEGVERYQASMRPTLFDLLALPDFLTRIRRRRARKYFGKFDRVVDRLLAARSRPDGQPKDLLARLIAARDEETGGGMTAEEVRDQVVTIFMAGHETTAVALTWTWYLLSQHPAVEGKLHAELDAVLAGRTPGYDDLANLPYTRMVIEESMRLYPPAHTLARQAVAADEVLGVTVPAGGMVLIAPWLIHRKASLWPEHERFDPERFAPERSAGRPRFAYIPFGAGPRVCIGAAFAMTEAMLILALIAQRFSLRLTPGHPVEPQGLITLRARHGMKMQLRRR